MRAANTIRAPPVLRRSEALDLTEHHSTLESLTDPFSPSASSAQYPDQGAGKTCTFTQRIAFPMASDAQGEFALAFTPKINYPLLSGTVAGTVVTWDAAYSAVAAVTSNLPNTYASRFRPISLGVRLYNTLSATNSSGYIIFAKGGPPTLSTTTTFNPSNFTSYEAHAYTHGGEWTSAIGPRSAEAYEMKNPSDYNTATSAALPDWETLYILLQGSAASSTPAFIELVWTVEYVPQEDAPIASMAVPQPILNIGMQTAVNHVQTSHPAVHKGGTAVIKAFIKREGKKAVLKHVLPFVAKKVTQALV